MSNVLTLGNVAFSTIDVDPTAVAKCLQTFVDRGSKVTGVDLDDLDLTTHTVMANANKASISELAGAGIPIFDAIVWVTAGRPASHPVTHDASKDEDECPNMASIASAVFYVFFMLVTQARYPYAGESAGGKVEKKDRPRIPAFLTKIMALKEDQESYMTTICSFSPEGFSPEWIKAVQFKNFGREVLSRFGLGVAGYRQFGPFKLYEHKEGIPENLIKAYNFARTVAMKPPTWSIHPVTRDPAVLTKRGNLNKNLSNLILDVFTDEQIDEMCTAKVLYGKPIRDPQHRNYLTWDEEDDISGEDFIFRE